MKDLEDISLDVPAAPRVLGRVVGLGAGQGLFELSEAGNQAKEVEGAEPRRNFVAAALLGYKEVKGEEDMVGAVKKSGVDVAALLAKDDEFESHLPSVAEFAKESGLGSVVL